jgi:hypothetical protein
MAEIETIYTKRAVFHVPTDDVERFLKEDVIFIGFVHLPGAQVAKLTNFAPLLAAFDDQLEIVNPRRRVADMVVQFDPDVDAAALRQWFSSRGYEIQEFPAVPANIESFAKNVIGVTMKASIAGGHIRKARKRKPN